jgi:CDP-glucose 4,6-dehydratase
VGFGDRALEGLVMQPEFWHGKRVLITGHTGFKGSWLALWLQRLGADLVGFALDPPTEPSLYQLANVAAGMTSFTGNVKDLEALSRVVDRYGPEIVFHFAAQSVVRDSYVDPVDTYATNVMGTVNLLDAVRRSGTTRAVVVATSDKCYENREQVWGYRENERLGGWDPYSSSKGCAEFVASAYRASFFCSSVDRQGDGVGVATVRAGNVIGGGDWTKDRLIPDIMRAIGAGRPVVIRNPNAVRPWQHVLEPLRGYAMLAERLWAERTEFAEAWNFGPRDGDAKPVQWVVERLASRWGDGVHWQVDQRDHPHEAQYLKLDSSKARTKLRWVPWWDLETSLGSIVEWYKALHSGADMRAIVAAQIDAYMASGAQD